MTRSRTRGSGITARRVTSIANPESKAAQEFAAKDFSFAARHDRIEQMALSFLASEGFSYQAGRLFKGDRRAYRMEYHEKIDIPEFDYKEDDTIDYAHRILVELNQTKNGLS